MKNIIKFLGIITITVIIGLVFSGCGEEPTTCTLKVVNQNDKPITYVSNHHYKFHWENLNIIKGTSKTFACKGFYNSHMDIAIGFGNPTTFVVIENVFFAEGKETTVTLTASGQLEQF